MADDSLVLRSSCAAIGSLLVLLASQTPASGQPRSPAPDPLVTVNQQNADVRDVLADIFRQAHVRYRLVNVGRAKITIVLSRTPLSMALRSVLNSVRGHGQRLTFEVKASVYIVRPQGTGAAKSNAGAGKGGALLRGPTRSNKG